MCFGAWVRRDVSLSFSWEDRGVSEARDIDEGVVRSDTLERMVWFGVWVRCDACLDPMSCTTLKHFPWCLLSEDLGLLRGGVWFVGGDLVAFSFRCGFRPCLLSWRCCCVLFDYGNSL